MLMFMYSVRSNSPENPQNMQKTTSSINKTPLMRQKKKGGRGEKGEGIENERIREMRWDRGDYKC